MRNNRVFMSFGSLNKAFRQHFIDVTATARAAGYNIRLCIETEIVRQ